MNRGLPAAARVVDFGVRGLDLVYAMQDGYETTILIDAFPHGQPPGTVSRSSRIPRGLRQRRETLSSRTA
jgi:Ni,Fe-hydrogenase maturation factor